MASKPSQLARVFRRKRVMDMSSLKDALGGRSRRSVFRDLAAIGYVSSYTHTGRYYTPAHIPKFDEHGLWVFQGVGFSKAGTLKSTVAALVHAAEAGRRHDELELIVRIRVHNTLLILVRDGSIRRERIEGAYLYVSAESARATEQIERREELLAERARGAVVLPDTTVIEVLSEALVAGGVRIAPPVVAARLSARGVSVSSEQVEGVFARYGIDAGKKTARPGSRRSRG
ncbi:MAG: hypothetical protein V3T69_12920 [Acidiferrobacterales bacterium]